MGARAVQQRLLAQRCRRARVLVLTYDDGPCPHFTRDVLDVLACWGAPATFYLHGVRARANPGIVKQVSAGGHEIGVHGFAHRNALRSAPWTEWAEIAEGSKCVESVLGAARLFRPPYGKVTPAGVAAARYYGLRFGWWTHDSGDTRSPLPSPDVVVEDVVRDGGGVVLLHDLGRSTHRDRFVLKTTEKLLQSAVREGLTLVRQGDLLTSRRMCVDSAA